MKNKNKYIQEFDELNTLISQAELSEVKELTETMLLLAYKRGVEDTEDDLDYFFDNELIIDEMAKSINKKIDGQTWQDRIEKIVNEVSFGGDAAGIQKIAETEYHRVYNEASIATAERIQKDSGKPVMKKWVTVKDDKVRATHEPLEGIEKPLNEKFYTIDGDEALAPGGFSKAENVVNCRCTLEYSF